MMLAGISPTVIVKNFNDRGILTPLAYIHSKGRHTIRKDGFEKLYWSTKTIYDIVQNETYTGAVVSLKSMVDRQTGGHHKIDRSEWVVVPGMHEPIVSKEEYDTVQKRITKRNISPSKYSIPLYCGICGKKLVRPKRGDRYCQRGKLVKNTECEGVKIKESDVAEAVLNELKKRLQDIVKEASKVLSKMDKGISSKSQIKAVESSLVAAEQAKKMLFERLVDRMIDREDFIRRKAEYDKEIEALKNELSDLKIIGESEEECEVKIREKNEEANFFMGMSKMTDEMWDRFVKKVLVFSDKRIEIVWNFDDEK